MAISEDKMRLFTTVKDGKKIGIALWEIYSCLRYYKRDKRGNRNLSLPIQFGDINKWAKYKPFEGSESNYDTKLLRDKARLAACQGLLIPNAKNSGLKASDGVYSRTYLAKLVELARFDKTPNWEYQRPTKWFRYLDFDGYNHLAKQPYQTYMRGYNKGNGTVAFRINRFETNKLTFGIQKLQGAEIELGDLFPDTMDYYYFVAERYLTTYTLSTLKPTSVFMASESIKNLTDYSVPQEIVIELDSTWDATNNGGHPWSIVLGVNKFADNVDTTKTDNVPVLNPDDLGAGFIEPWVDSQLLPIYYFYVDYYAVINFIQKAGYYVASGSSSNFTSFNPKDYDFTGWRKTYSDKVGLALDFQKMAEDYTIVGATANTNNLPKKGFKIWVRARYLDRYVVATVAGSDIQSNVSTNNNNYQTIFAGQGEKQTVYLRFDGLIKQGEQIDSIELQFSTDGTTYAPLGNVEAGFDSSSVRLRLQY